MKATIKPGDVTVVLDLTGEEFATLQRVWEDSSYRIFPTSRPTAEEIEFYAEAQKLVRAITKGERAIG